MKDGLFGLNSVFLGAFAAGISIVIVFGSMLLAFTEGAQTSSIAAYPTLESIDISTPSIQLTPTEAPTETSISMPTTTPLPSPTLSPTVIRTESQSAEPAVCDPPPGWFAYTVKTGDTLNKLSASTGVTPQELADANCLSESRLMPGSILYLPPIQPTATPVRCGAPANWVIYVVQPGDTLFNIAERVNSTVSQLKYANCLTSDNIRSGQKLYVPYQPAPIVSPTYPPPTTQPPAPTGTLVPTATPTDSNISKRTPPYPYPSP